jgi:hypothetical protein
MGLIMRLGDVYETRGDSDRHHPLTVNRLAALSAGLSFSGEPEPAIFKVVVA